MKLRVPPTEKISPGIKYLRTPFKVQVEYIWESLLETSRIASRPRNIIFGNTSAIKPFAKGFLKLS